MQQTSTFFWSAVLTILPLIVIAVAIRRARGTTLVAPLSWALLAYSVLFLTTMASYLRGASTADNLVYIASTATLCPTIALFGAKRPQNRAWQLIVLAFWFVAALPAIQFLVMRPGTTLELHLIWKFFLLILIVAGGINYLLTRFAWASLLVMVGQTLLLWKSLPGTTPLLTFIGPGHGMVALMIGIGLAFLAQRRRGEHLSPYRGWNRAWLDFRDFYGVVWALRIMERVNSLPAALEVGVRLNWTGFCQIQPNSAHDNCGAAGNKSQLPGSDERWLDVAAFAPASPDALVPLDSALRNLMRRFISREWLDKRLQIKQTGKE